MTIVSTRLGVLGLVMAVSSATISANGRNPVSVGWLGGQPCPVATGVSWGVPWPDGSLAKSDGLTLSTSDGKSLPLQSWPLAYWPDGSVKWTGLATVLSPDARGPFEIRAAAHPGRSATGLVVRETTDRITVNTGPMACVIARSGDRLIDSISVNGVQVGVDGRLICVRQDGPDGGPADSPRRELCVGRIEKVAIEQAGPVRAVLKIEGRHRGVDSGRLWLPFVVRLYFYAGQQPIRIVHTFVYDGDAHKDFIHGLGLEFGVPLREQAQNRHVRFSGESGGLWSEPIQPGAGNARQQEGKPIPPGGFYGDKGGYAIWSDFKLTQSAPGGFTIFKRTNPQSSWVFGGAGARASGFAFVGDVRGGLGVSVRNFWQSYPDELDVRDAAAPVARLTAWLWSPDAPSMDLRHYDTRAHGLDATYEDVQPGLSTPFGVARTSELELFPVSGIPSKAGTVALARRGTTVPLLVATPEYIHSTGVFGVWSLPDRSTPLKSAVEDRLDGLLRFYEEQVNERNWYGFWYYGDFIHSYNRAAHKWYYDFGGHAWDNTELATPLWLWYSFLRTGREDVFRLAEALTRNTSETCVYHIGPMAGLGSRHNVSKWGDGAKEARISQAAHWRPYYYLTTDERVGDIMRETVRADLAVIRYDPMREAQPVLPQDPKYPGRMRIGPDWFALAGDWMTEWERTGDNRWRDRIVAGVDSILKMPYWLRSGVRNGLNPQLGEDRIGPLKGGGSMTVGYDPATGRLLPIPDPIAHTQVPVNYNLSTIQGGAEVMFELIPLLGRADWAKAWLQYCRLGNAPARVLEKDRTTGDEGADARYVERGQAGWRLAAYAYAKTGDPAYARVAITALALYGKLQSQPVSVPDALQTVHEARLARPFRGGNPAWRAPYVSTNDASQSSLTTIEILAFCHDQLPRELPPIRDLPPFRRRRSGRPGGEPSHSAAEELPDNQATGGAARRLPDR